jgi:hypothetical protein
METILLNLILNVQNDCEIDVLLMVGITMVLFAALTILIVFSKYEDGYKDGQVDAINGKIKYKLEEREDKTTDWVEIKNKKS